MTRVIMHGCNGHMGQVITGLIKNDPVILYLQIFLHATWKQML